MKHLFLILFLVCGISLSAEAAGVITISGKSYPVDTIAHYDIGPGTRFTNLNVIDGQYPLLLHFLEIDATNPYINFKSETSKDAMLGMEGITSIAKRKTTPGNVYFAGINGDFYNMTTGEPVNGYASRKEIGRMPISDRPVIGTTADKFPLLDIMKFSGVVTLGTETFNISNTNITRGTNHLILFNRFQGGKTGTNVYGTEVLVELEEASSWAFNKQLKVKVVEKEVGVGNMMVPAGKAVLSGNGTAQTFLNKMKVGDEVLLDLSLSLKSQPTASFDISEIIGGDRVILRDGQIDNNDWVQREPRTSMGYSADGKKIFFCVVDGRATFSAGVSTKMLAELMKHAGAATAVNLDGGGSSGLYIKEYGLVNNKGTGVERQVSNGFFAVSTAPEDNTVASIGFMKDRFEVPIYSKMKPIIVAYNKYGQLLSKNVPATLSCPSELGSVDESGEYSAGGEVLQNALTATYLGLTTTATVSIVNKAEVAIMLDSLLIDSRREYKIDIIGSLYGNKYPIEGKALVWTVENPSVCEVKAGILKGLAAGETLVIGSLGDFSDTIKVKVEPLEEPYIQTKFEDVSNFNFAGSVSNLQDILASQEGIPSGWAHGANISYTYASLGRSSTLKVSDPMTLYSLADTICFTLNVGESEINRLIFSFMANNETRVKKMEFKSLPKNQDIELKISSKELFGSDDIALFPIEFRDMVFYLNDAAFVPGKKYNIYLKDLKVYAEGQLSGIENTQFGQDALIIYPNPAKADVVTIVLPSEGNETVKVEVLALSGQTVKVVNLGIPGSNEVSLPLHGLPNGSYLVKVTEGNSKATIGKLIIAK